MASKTDNGEHDRTRQHDPVWDRPPEVQAIIDDFDALPMDTESCRRRLIDAGIIDEDGNDLIKKRYAKVSRADSSVYLDD